MEEHNDNNNYLLYFYILFSSINIVAVMNEKP